MKNNRKRVVFVCTGNICRSPLAEAVLRDELEARGAGDRFELDSAGLDAYHVGDHSDPRMRMVAKSHGVRINHRSRKFRSRELEDADYVFAMDSGHFRTLSRMAERHNADGKVVMFRDFDPVRDGEYPDVPDPWYGSYDGFERVYDIVSRTCSRIADQLVDGNDDR